MTQQINMPEYAWRAELLTKMMLTRRVDVAVVHPSPPYDLSVELIEDGTRTGQVFAVEVKATLNPAGFGRALEGGEVALHGEWRANLRQLATRAHDLPYPLCFVGFAMTTDEGYYAWVRRPVRDGSAAGLVTECPESLLPFTNEAIADIVSLVRGWYLERRPHAAAV